MKEDEEDDKQSRDGVELRNKKAEIHETEKNPRRIGQKGEEGLQKDSNFFWDMRERRGETVKVLMGKMTEAYGGG